MMMLPVTLSAVCLLGFLLQVQLIALLPSATATVRSSSNQLPPKTGVHVFANVDAATRTNKEYWREKCGDIPETAPYLLLRMGNAWDYFKPSVGSTYCEMLQSQSKHQWSRDGLNWIQPSYKGVSYKVGRYVKIHDIPFMVKIAATTGSVAYAESEGNILVQFKLGDSSADNVSGWTDPFVLGKGNAKGLIVTKTFSEKDLDFYPSYMKLTMSTTGAWVYSKVEVNGVVLTTETEGIHKNKGKTGTMWQEERVFPLNCPDYHLNLREVEAFTDTAARQTCTDLGWTVGLTKGDQTVCAASVECYASKNFEQAGDICSAAGSRLCTGPEVAAGIAKGSGCSFDTKLIWTSTACKTGGSDAFDGFKAKRGDGDAAGSICKAKWDATMAVRCCSDTLKWPRTEAASATMSSTAKGSPARNCIDNIKSTICHSKYVEHNGTSVNTSQTLVSSKHWLRVDYGKRIFRKIVIQNQLGYGQRLRIAGATVSLTEDEEGKRVVWSSKLEGAKETYTFVLDGDLDRLGGSTKDWPSKMDSTDKRTYLPFWGTPSGTEPNYLGGCCSSSITMPDIRWRSPFTFAFGVTLRPLPKNTGISVFSTTKGTEGRDATYWLEACKIIPNKALFLVLNIGTIREYFKPVAGSTFCDMLVTNTKHQWSSDGINWKIPAYNTQGADPNNYLGGSEQNYPKGSAGAPYDGRSTLTFWGHNGSNRRNGGCCSTLYSEPDESVDRNSSWLKPFTFHYALHLQPLPENTGMSLVADVAGTTVANNMFWADKCKGIPASTIFLVLDMGAARDFIRPINSATSYCDMLLTNDKHQYSSDGLTWTTPNYYEHKSNTGGSKGNWPQDNGQAGDERMHLSFWGTVNSTCSSTFQTTRNAAITGHNKESSPKNVSPEECMELCCARSWCNSFDYHTRSNRCDLSDAPVELSSQLKPNDGVYDHYARTDGKQTGGCCSSSTAVDKTYPTTQQWGWGQTFSMFYAIQLQPLPPATDVSLVADVTGTTVTNTAYWAEKCKMIPSTTVFLVLTMGASRDFIRPINSATSYCDMLLTNDKHQYSSDGLTWTTPNYYEQKSNTGGSKGNWPQDNGQAGDERKYLSFWGSPLGTGGCCSSSSTASLTHPSLPANGIYTWWGQAFRMIYATRQPTTTTTSTVSSTTDTATTMTTTTTSTSTTATVALCDSPKEDPAICKSIEYKECTTSEHVTKECPKLCHKCSIHNSNNTDNSINNVQQVATDNSEEGGNSATIIVVVVLVVILILCALVGIFVYNRGKKDAFAGHGQRHLVHNAAFNKYHEGNDVLPPPYDENFLEVGHEGKTVLRNSSSSASSSHVERCAKCKAKTQFCTCTMRRTTASERKRSKSAGSKSVRKPRAASMLSTSKAKTRASTRTTRSATLGTADRGRMSDVGSGNRPVAPFHVMLSYAAEERDLAKKIHSRLQELGFDVWIDIEQHPGAAHTRLSNHAKAQAIENAEGFVYCMSSNYKMSEECHMESNYAHQQKKPMLPVMVEDAYAPNGWLGFLLGTTLWYGISAKTAQDEARFNAKVDELANVLYHVTSHDKNQYEDGDVPPAINCDGKVHLYENIYGTGEKLPDYECVYDNPNPESNQSTSAASKPSLQIAEANKKSTLRKHKRMSMKVKPLTGQYHVMLSYAWAQQETVKKIRTKLDELGFVVWFDLEKMEGSTVDAMASAIENSEAFIYCMSINYKDSKNCHAEANYAHVQKKPMLPLVVQEGYVPDGWLGFLLGTARHFDFWDNVVSNESEFNSAMHKVECVLNQITSHRTLAPDVVWGGYNIDEIYGDGKAIPKYSEVTHTTMYETPPPSSPVKDNPLETVHTAGGGTPPPRPRPLKVNPLETVHTTMCETPPPLPTKARQVDGEHPAVRPLEGNYNNRQLQGYHQPTSVTNTYSHMHSISAPQLPPRDGLESNTANEARANSLVQPASNNMYDTGVPNASEAQEHLYGPVAEA